MTVQDLKLGKKLGRVVDPRTFQLPEFMPRTALSELHIPDAWRLAGNRHKVPMYKNDAYGDCTIVSSAHRIIVQEAAVAQRELTITEEQVVSKYFKLSGGQDTGLYMLDVANDQRHVGLGQERDGTPHTVLAFIEVPVQKLEYVRAAALVFGGLWAGVWLPMSAQDGYRQGLWDVPPQGPIGDGAPGSWGGHAIYLPGYDEAGLPLYTWAHEIKMTWAFWRAYVDECFVFITEDYLRRIQQTTPRGFDVARLQGYMRELSG